MSETFGRGGKDGYVQVSDQNGRKMGMQSVEDIQRGIAESVDDRPDERDRIEAKTYLEDEQTDLGLAIERAIRDCRDRGVNGEIRVRSKPDGTAWPWRRSVEYDADESGVSLSIVLDRGTRIEYENNYIPLIVRNAWNNGFGLYGGKWYSTGDPQAWLKLDCSIRNDIHPTYVDYKTDQGTVHNAGTLIEHTGAVALIIANQGDTWSELNRISGDYKVDNGIDFRPPWVYADIADLDGDGTGTSSFQTNRFADMMVNIEMDGGFCWRIRGNQQYSEFRGIANHLNGRDSYGIILGTDDPGTDSASGMSKFAWYTTKFEMNQYQGSGMAIKTLDSFDDYYSPIFVNPHVSGTIGEEIVGPDDTADSASTAIPKITGGYRDIILGSFGSGNTLRYGMDRGILSNVGGIDVEGMDNDVRYLPGFLKREGMIMIHNGAGNMKGGPAYHDGDGWTSMVDGSTF